MKTDEPTGETVADQPRERFKNRSVAWRWVKDQLRGKAVALSQRKFYDDGVAGRYLVYPDKSVSRASVAEYLLKAMGDAPVVDLNLVDRNQEKGRLELRKLELEVDRLAIRARSEDREWMRTDDHWAQLMAGYNLLRGNLEHFARISATEIVLEAGGDYHQGPLVADKVVEMVINKAFNELAVMRIESGEFEAEEESGDE